MKPATGSAAAPTSCARAALFTHLQILNSQYNLPPFPKKLSFAANRAELQIAERFADSSVQHSAAVDLAVIDVLDTQIADLELYLVRRAKVDDVQTYYRLQTIPGVGKVLALVLLYEIHDIRRFAAAGPFLSYSRLVRCSHESAGKKLGSGGAKIGNGHLRWAFAEAACLFLPCSERAKKWKDVLTRGHNRATTVADDEHRPLPRLLRLEPESLLPDVQPLAPAATPGGRRPPLWRDFLMSQDSRAEQVRREDGILGSPGFRRRLRSAAG